MAATLAALPTLRLRARLLYDGAAYQGVQYQPNAPTVAGVLQRALSTRMRHDVKVVPAGRTDTGVHARGQAVHFDVDAERFAADGVDQLQHAVNCLMSDDVRVAEIEAAPEVDEDGRAWHAIYWSTGKLYTYRFYTGRVMDPTQRAFRHHVRPAGRGAARFDLDEARLAAQLLVGEHDFASFANTRANEPGFLDTVRTVRSIAIHDEGDGFARAEVHVKGALYKQVRNMMGLLFEVGRGARGAPEVSDLLARRSRVLLPKPAPAHGLTLEQVFYRTGWGGRYDHPLHTDMVGSGSILRSDVAD